MVGSQLEQGAGGVTTTAPEPVPLVGRDRGVHVCRTACSADVAGSAAWQGVALLGSTAVSPYTRGIADHAGVFICCSELLWFCFSGSTKAAE
jgi:hypothetical protein